MKVLIYTWPDIHVVARDNFHRIRNCEEDRTSTFSKVAKVDIAGNSGEITVFPNPVTGRVISRRDYPV